MSMPQLPEGRQVGSGLGDLRWDSNINKEHNVFVPSTVKELLVYL